MNTLFASGFLFGLSAGLVWHLLDRRRFVKRVQEVMQL